MKVAALVNIHKGLFAGKVNDWKAVSECNELTKRSQGKDARWFAGSFRFVRLMDIRTRNQWIDGCLQRFRRTDKAGEIEEG